MLIKEIGPSQQQAPMWELVGNCASVPGTPARHSSCCDSTHACRSTATCGCRDRNSRSEQSTTDRSRRRSCVLSFRFTRRGRTHAVYLFCEAQLAKVSLLVSRQNTECSPIMTARFQKLVIRVTGTLAVTPPRQTISATGEPNCFARSVHEPTLDI